MSRVTEIRYVGYGVVEFEAEKNYYVDAFGLELVDSDNNTAWLKTQGHDEHHVVRLRKAEANRLDVISLAAASRSDVDTLCDKARAAGCSLVCEPHELNTPGGGYGFRFFSPDGLQIEISCDVARGGKRGLAHWEGLPVKISHIVLHSPQHQELVQFFTDVLGFKISDWLGDFMCFLRCNSAHHRIAILPGPPCLNHVAYDMLSVDDMMRGAHRLKLKGTEIQWGPGRHTAGNNAFSYFVTPAGFAVEYTADLEEVDFDTHEAKVHVPAPLVMDQWGIGVGGPQTMPHPAPNPGLFVAVEG
ncbi:MAG: oxidoreductase [Novosphingobium sp. 17-62-19]|uniref:VOC family protein n=1 Tax=Novosphingobium sp. 17-62-19 TaxID=1970406 RepID=UPI000BC56990|nr:VOC family protein [Novosphingobium sp. 17-62-19]OYX92229.1 MAG: oxidoreductase [Novosphingobium sp. 35-62-5]OZA21434.1 MAG: oxidoreductase [Novosphingobium sp. 17-62-19]OZA68102.1 MAG: oxidoreductase [Sphingomonadales bacterium 39-62-4]HQS96085.1 VOC family protein [Novosphingobium sp.]